jgi:RNA polymerase sigma-70 factor (ECF subfamily)
MPDALRAHEQDRRLLERCAAREPAAVREMLDVVAPVVYGFIYARVGGDEAVAEDLLQETLLEAVRSSAGYRGEAALSTWMCAIAKHRLARHYRIERRQELARSGLRLVGEEEEVDFSESMERHDRVIRALGRLSGTHRQVLVLKYLDEQSVEDIAGELGRSRVQVQSLLQRARDALRRELDEEDG